LLGLLSLDFGFSLSSFELLILLSLPGHLIVFPSYLFVIPGYLRLFES
jgi:hypothetical protein